MTTQPARATIGEHLEDVLDILEKRGTEDHPVGVRTGFRDIDFVLDGLQAGLVHLLFGATGVGTSTLALNFARSAAVTHGLPTLLLSAQSPRREVILRVLSAEARVPLHHMRSGTMTDGDWTRLSKTMGKIASVPLVIDDRPYRDFAAVARTLQRPDAQSFQLLIIDGTNLLARPTAPESLWAAHARVAADIKRLATQLNLATVVTTPVNRRLDNRIDPRPTLPDVASSSAYVADADVVIGVHRDDLWNRESPRAGEADLMILKNRYGPTVTITVAFQGHYSRFVDMATS